LCNSRFTSDIRNTAKGKKRGKGEKERGGERGEEGVYAPTLNLQFLATPLRLNTKWARKMSPFLYTL